MRRRSHFLAHSAIIAALYAVLCHFQNLLLPGSATWAIQMRLSEALNVPLEVWAGGKAFVPTELSTAAYEVARAYETASLKDKNTARLALNLELVKEETI